MSKNAMDHVVLTDDSGGGTDGTPINNALFDQVQDAIDVAIGQVVQAKSGDYTVVVTDDVVKFTAAATATLYTASGNSGRLITIINRSTGDIVIDGNASETVNGATTLTIGPGDMAILRMDGSNVIGGVVYDSLQIALMAQVFG